MAVENVNYDEPLLSFTLVLNATAEQPLVVDTLDPENWSAVYQGVAFSAYEAEVSAFDRVAVIVQAGAPAAGADSVSYAADPPDVRATRPSAAEWALRRLVAWWRTARSPRPTAGA